VNLSRPLSETTQSRMYAPTGLTGKTALVTGASRGIGRAIVLTLGGRRAQVIVHYAREERLAEDVVAEIRNFGGRAEKLATDLSAKDGAHQLARKVREIIGERLDILVANAGISVTTDLQTTEVDEFDRLYAINVRAPYFLVQQLLPLMWKESSIIFITGLTMRTAAGRLPPYASIAGGIDTLIRQFAAALSPLGIRVNGVAPGVVEADSSSFGRTSSCHDRTNAMPAPKHFARPAEVADAVAFLASHEARSITGQTVHIDGELHL